MLKEFVRLTIYVPASEPSGEAAPDMTTASSVQAALRVLSRFAFAGNVGTYQDVVEISAGTETYVPTDASAPTHGAAGARSIVPSARLVTYIPATTSEEDLTTLIDEVAAAHPWEHPVIEVDRVSLWMP